MSRCPADLATLLDFVRQHGRPCMAQWSAEMVLEYLQFHLSDETLVVAMDGRAVVGLSVVWIGSVRSLEDHWRRNEPSGNAGYLAHWIATSRESSQVMAQEWLRRFPQLDDLPVWMRRGERGLVPVSRRFWKRFLQ